MGAFTRSEQIQWVDVHVYVLVWSNRCCFVVVGNGGVNLSDGQTADLNSRSTSLWYNTLDSSQG